MRFINQLPKYQLDGMPYEGEGFAVEGSYGKGGGSTTTVQKADPWEGQQPYLTDIYQQAQQQYQAGPDLYPNINPIAPWSQQTHDALGAISGPGYATGAVQDSVLSGLNATLGGPSNVDQYLRGVGSRGTGVGVGSGVDVGANIDMVQSQTGPSWQEGVAGVNSVDSLQNILSGGDSAIMQEYMQQANQDITDNLMQNNLMPQQIALLQSGGYGGSSGQNIRRQTAVDVADQQGQSNNRLFLDQQGRQLQAAGIVSGAQQGVDQYNLGQANAGIGAAGVQAQDNASQRSAATSRANMADSNALQAAMFADQYGLDQAKLGGFLNPLYDDLQYGDAQRNLQVGSAYDARAQAEVDAEIQRQLYDSGADNRALAEYAGLVYGSGSPGSSSTSKASGGGSSTAAGALGGAATAAGLIGMTGGLGTAAAGGTAATAGWAGAAGAMGPPGWAALAGAAILGSGILG